MQDLLTYKDSTIEYLYPNLDSAAIPNFNKFIIKAILSPKVWGFNTHRAVTITIDNETHSFNY